MRTANEVVRYHDANDIAPLREEIVRRLCTILAVTYPPRNWPDILMKDLGADSLDIVELAMELEEEEDIIIEAKDADSVRTISDFVELLLRQRMRWHRGR